MSQQPPQNNRPRRELNNNQPSQGAYPPSNQQQNNPSYGQQPPQGRPMPPRPPQPYTNKPVPQQPPEPQRIYIERDNKNPIVSAILTILYVIAFPFIKIAQLIGNLVKIILEELVRSVVSFVLGVIFLIVFVALIIGYVYALIQVEFNFVAAVPEMLRIFGSFIGFGG